MVTNFGNPPLPPFRKGGVGGILSEFLISSGYAGLGFNLLAFMKLPIINLCVLCVLCGKEILKIFPQLPLIHRGV